MHCPVCNFEGTNVVDSRVVEDGKSVRRRRRCPDCGHRFTTYERLNEKPIVVIKRDKSSEPFDRAKLLRGLLTATAKRNIPLATLEGLIADIENEIRSANKSEIASSVLGDKVLDRLRDLDELAYIRFASVYKDFKSAEEFIQEINSLSK